MLCWPFHQKAVTIVKESSCCAVEVGGSTSKQHPILGVVQVMLEERKASWRHLSMINFFNVGRVHISGSRMSKDMYLTTETKQFLW